jgi:hypothetical protein
MCDSAGRASAMTRGLAILMGSAMFAWAPGRLGTGGAGVIGPDSPTAKE